MSPWIIAVIATTQTTTVPGLISEPRDTVRLAHPGRVILGGLLGERARLSVDNRLTRVDEAELLAGFFTKPGSHPWIGEHAGKFLHAACLALMNRDEPELRAKAKRVAEGLMSAQEADGYLGTYEAESRFTLKPNREWDVWSHKYCLLGLLSWHGVSGDPRALKACSKAANLLIQTFGAGAKILSETSAHEGMASTSVLEPIVALYHVTKDPRLLEFAKRIVKSFDEPKGSHLIQDILETGAVDHASNGKAYEMLSNLIGLVDLYRATGDPEYLLPAKIAWKDISNNRLYLTGTGSSREHWTHDGVLPCEDQDNVGENCVSVSWIQLNSALYKLEGESKYLDEIEATLYNHLLGSQRPDGAAWCYYSPLNGARSFGTATNCCLSSGPRAVALLPSLAYGLRSNGMDINLFGDSSVSGSLELEQESSFPEGEWVRIKVRNAPAAARILRLRVPKWASLADVSLNGRPIGKGKPGSWFELKRKWHRGDLVALHMPMLLRRVLGEGSMRGHVAWMKGPLVYCALPRTPVMDDPALSIGASSEPTMDKTKGRFELSGFTEIEKYSQFGGRSASSVDLELLPYYMAPERTRYAVWLRLAPFGPPSDSPFAGAKASSSRKGNVSGSIVDGDWRTFQVTYNQELSAEDWHSVVLDHPVTISIVVFRHGRSFHDGGWFDAAGGKPQVQILDPRDHSWKEVGRLVTYPQTTSRSPGSLYEGQQFRLKFEPREALGIRVVGHPASGDTPTQNFTSCSELAGF